MRTTVVSFDEVARRWTATVLDGDTVLVSMPGWFSEQQARSAGSVWQPEAERRYWHMENGRKVYGRPGR